MEALRSGEYQQTQGRLFRAEPADGYPAGYCCLGVLTDLYCKAKGVTFDGVTRSNKGTLNLSVKRWAGLNSFNPEVFLFSGTRSSLAQLNDSGYTFAEIADIVEREL